VNSRILTALRSQSITIRTAALAAACVFGAAVAGAQTAPAAAGSSASGKVGVISIRQAIVATAEGKLAQAELQSQFAPRQTEIENLTKQINDIQQQLQLGTKLSEERQAELTRQGTKLTQQLDRKRNEFQEDVNNAQGEVFDRIGKKMIDVLDQYSRTNGISVVLDTSAQGSPVLYFSNQIDMTQDIIHLYDQSYPVKQGAGAQPRPAAPKPTAPPTSKP